MAKQMTKAEKERDEKRVDALRLVSQASVRMLRLADEQRQQSSRTMKLHNDLEAALKALLEAIAQ